MFFVLFQPIIQKKIFFYRFLGRFSPALHRRSDLMAPCLTLRKEDVRRVLWENNIRPRE